MRMRRRIIGLPWLLESDGGYSVGVFLTGGATAELAREDDIVLARQVQRSLADGVYQGVHHGVTYTVRGRTLIMDGRA
jgi:hypothetical protein